MAIMKNRRTVCGAALLLAFFSACAFAQGGKQKASSGSQNSIDPFLGRWDLTLKAGMKEYPSWLNLYQTGGVLKAEMTARWGNARPLPKVEINGGVLTFVSPKEEEGSKADMVFKAKLVNDSLVGSVNGPDGNPWTWIGEKAPSLAGETVSHWGEPISLFNGKNLDGWDEYSAGEFPSAGHWTVVNGTLVSPGNGPELVNKKSFDNFKLHVEFNLGPESNSGVYLRGRYEVQIENESAEEPPSHHTGGVYGFLAPHPELPRTTGKWQTFDITFIGRWVTIVLDGTTIIDNKEIPGLTGGALNSHEGQPGPIMLQGGEKGHVSFRNIVITPAAN
jgi:hypothetical protein